MANMHKSIYMHTLQLYTEYEYIQYTMCVAPPYYTSWIFDRNVQSKYDGSDWYGSQVIYFESRLVAHTIYIHYAIMHYCIYL